ncbi:hypothetical protein RE428_14700 [Marinobacter nanhaiticus D15-8W]|uniref:Acetolactate synthase n=1 Tax=Marinobacter nanhaiticus D15-8W TaxID=626887 RepID=N6WNK0_9GAMM|nr:ACT domain-containing protein [Marinobacter nanhaiticus]ENO13096.1 acetolactate synthase [Marinobacter nanhaiticus D15-8W]BES70452.1 hypothetical protein RE428_14700 [Marinobacter nanhaiticus D15-8W]
MTTSTENAKTHTLTCRMAAEAAAIERLCQVTRIRGFRIEQMQVQTDAGELEISMTLSGERSIDMLRSQIEKLHTVLSLQPEAMPSPGTAADMRQTA